MEKLHRTVSLCIQVPHRATRLRTQNGSARVIRLVNEDGVQQYVWQHGRMSITKHTTVLSALGKQAFRYRWKGNKLVDWDEALYENALDKTGTASTTGMTAVESDNATIATEFAERLEIEGVIRGIVGSWIGARKNHDGVTRLI